jgi:hypothetical protein
VPRRSRPVTATQRDPISKTERKKGRKEGGMIDKKEGRRKG